MGPVTVFPERGDQVLGLAAAITVRYSDAPGDTPVRLCLKHSESEELISKAMPVEEIEIYRV